MFKEEKLRRSLAAFTRAAWENIPSETGRPLVWGFHLDAICEHLEAVYIHKQITHLLIEIPPGCTKTKLTGTLLPAWLWTRQANHRFLFVGNNQDLANEESMTCRNLIESDWYRGTFRVPWELAEDQDAKSWYKNTAGGHRLCRGIFSNTQGRKGDSVIVDDANDARKIQSAAERRRVNLAYDSSIYNRVIDFIGGVRIIIAQRTGEDDLIGHVKNHGGWECLTIPEEFDRKHRVTTCIGWTDPRKNDGEMLRPFQFGPEQIRRERSKNLLIYQAQHLQRPRSAEGIRFKLQWFQNRWRFDTDRHNVILTDQRGEYRFNPYGEGCRQRYGTADGAASASTAADYTAIGTWIITERFDLIWFACKRQQLEIPDQPAVLQAQYNKWKMEFCGVEEEFGNRALAQHGRRMPMIIRSLNTKGNDKLTRATPAMILAESGRFWLPDDDAALQNDFPLGEVETELTSFTGDDKLDLHDDLIDIASYATEYFNQIDVTGGDTAGPTITAKPAAGGWLAAGGAGSAGGTPGSMFGGRNPFMK